MMFSRHSGILSRVASVLRYVLLGLAVLYLGAYLFIALNRIQYPFDLEWMEGGSVDHIIRILSGQELYVRPSLDFVSYAYTPLYFYVSTAVAKLIGVGYTPLRLVSFLASLGCFSIIFLIVKRDTGSTFHGILAAGLFAATFRIGGAWFDLARVDTLFLFFMLAALYLIRFKESNKYYLLAGVLVSLSFLTKQTALIIALPLMLYSVLVNWRRSVYVIGSVLFLLIGSTVCLNHIHEGWYSYYIFGSRASHTIVKHMLVDFWVEDIFLAVFVVCLMTVFFFVTLIIDKNRKNLLFYCLALTGMLSASWASRLSDRGYNNVLLPAYAILAITFGLGTYAVHKFIRKMPEQRQVMVKVYVYFMCIVQFATLRYSPLDQIPSHKDLDSGLYVMQTISEIDGDVFVPYHGYLSVQAGKGQHASSMALFDIVGWDAGSEVAKALSTEIRQAIESQQFAAIVLDEPSSWFSQIWFPETTEYYIEGQVLFDDPDVFWPVTGMRTRPQSLYVPKDGVHQ